MPAFRRQQVQHSCQSLLLALGYDEPDSSEEDVEKGFEKEGGREPGKIQSSSQELGVVSDAAAIVGPAEAAINLGGREKGWRASPSSSSSSASSAAFGRVEGGSAPGAAPGVIAGEDPYSPAAAVPATA